MDNVSIDQLANRIHSDNPMWTIESTKNLASEYVSRWDNCFSDLVNDYLSQGVERDFQYGEFSLFLIKALRHNCSYLIAIDLMNSYMSDPLNGKALILRR